MIVYYNLSKDSELTEEQREEIRRAASMPSVYDEDSPETTPEMIEEFKRVALAKKE